MGDAKVQEETTSTRYQVLGRLAGGGMADIYLARATSDGGIERHVVLKRVLAERARDPHMVKMFLDEARLASQLQHPNIAQVFDFGKLAGAYFFTMEYVHGADVRALLHRLAALKKPLPINLAFHVASNVLAGLHHAHTRTDPGGKSLGVVHRDVSPSNVMVSFDGVIKLLDFGVAKASQHTAESRTGVKGKIAYLSPEQCRCRPLDCRSDIYSLGIVLHEMLTSRRLYRRESDFETMQAIVEGTPPPPSAARRELTPAIDALVLKALAKDPAERFASAAEMAEELETIAAKEGLRLSVLAMGKFMRELYGERPEPWAELATAEDIKPLTITRESADMLQFADEAQLAPAMSSLELELERAPVIEVRPSEGNISLPSMTGGPRDEPTPSVQPAPRDEVTPSVPLVTESVPNVAPPFVELSSPSVVPLRPSRRPLVIAIAAVATIAIGVVIAIAMSGSKSRPTPDAGMAIATADAAIAGEPDSAPIVEPDAAVTPAPAPTIAGELGNKNWSNVLALCAKQKPNELSTADREKCGIAACTTRQRANALLYHAGAPSSTRTAIERACKTHGIALVTPTRQPPPPKDPCEKNPLRCQK